MTVGTKIGLWTVVSTEGSPRITRSGYHSPRVICQCSCGTVRPVEVVSLRRGHSTSCGCRKKLYGPDNPGWKGGKYKSRDGYIVVQGEKRDGHKQPCRLEHRVVMERVLGRKLHTSEQVHHRNGNRSDNRPENLELWISRQPMGQRVEDLCVYAVEILKVYKPELLA